MARLAMKKWLNFSMQMARWSTCLKCGIFLANVVMKRKRLSDIVSTFSRPPPEHLLTECDKHENTIHRVKASTRTHKKREKRGSKKEAEIFKMKKYIPRIDKTDGLIRRKPRSKRKVEIFCKMAEIAVEEGVIFEGNRIVEILPWED